MLGACYLYYEGNEMHALSKQMAVITTTPLLSLTVSSSPPPDTIILDDVGRGLRLEAALGKQKNMKWD